MPRRATALVLLAFAAAFVALEVNAYSRKSATWDEPMHLASGYAALARNDHRLDPSHPPLVRMWAALPLLLDRPFLDTRAIDGSRGQAWLLQAYTLAHRFLYVQNDADRLLYRARFMVVLLGVALGILLFCWVREWLGAAPAIVALILYAMEPNIAAHSALVTTDLGVTCLMFGAVYFLWRTMRRRSTGNAAGFVVCVALALVTKFSAVVLLPLAALLLAVAAHRRTIGARTALGLFAAAVAAAFVLIWIVYGMRYTPSASPDWVFALHRSAIDAHRLLPNAFTQGFIYNQSSVQQVGAFLAGQYSLDGWWYYFPFAFAIKTPLVLLALFTAGCVVIGRRWQRDALTLTFIVLPLVGYAAVAMISGINLGLRHLLPIYPFVLLVASAAVAALLARGRHGRMAVAALVAALALEFGTSYPHNLAFFNALVGGPANGFRYLTDSNVGWGQNLKPLKAWMDRNDVAHINLAYFGQADPDYYMIDATHLPGAPTFALSRIGRPHLPGYVAISPTILSGVYLQPRWRLFYAAFSDLEPVAVVGNSIRVYWVEQWPELAGDGGDIDAHLSLAEALLFAMEWPDHAAVHCRHVLEIDPTNARARDCLHHLDARQLSARQRQ
jgi:hypothetical protein